LGYNFSGKNYVCQYSLPITNVNTNFNFANVKKTLSIHFVRNWVQHCIEAPIETAARKMIQSKGRNISFQVAIFKNLLCRLQEPFVLAIIFEITTLTFANK
jgi:hypothetical protein